MLSKLDPQELSGLIVAVILLIVSIGAVWADHVSRRK
jgi:hypothetical protein